MIINENERKLKLVHVGIILLVVFLSIIILYSPYFIREQSNNSVPLGTTPYYHMRVINKVIEGQHLMWDNLVIDGRLIQVNLFHIIFASVAKHFSLEDMALFLPPIFGIASILLFYFILRKVGLDEKHLLFSLLVLIVSSNFIFPFVTFSPSFFSIFLFLLAVLLYLKKKIWSYIFSMILFIMISLIGTLDAIVSLLLLFAIHLVIKESSKRFVLLAGVSFVTMTAFNVPFILFRGLPNSIINTGSSLVTKMFSEFGGVEGYNMLVLLLSLLGLIMVWGIRKEFVASYVLVLFAFVISMFFIWTSPYLSFICAVLSGITIKELAYRRWRLDLIKNLTMLLLICTIIFSIITYLILFSAFPPNKGFVNSLEELRTISSPDDRIFSHPDNGFWIETIANRMVLLDNFPDYINDSKEKANDTETIFHSRNLEITKALLDKYSIRYIFIEPSMFEGKVWYEGDEGLTFLFRNNETFKNVYDKNGVEVWEYKKQANLN